MRNLLMIVYLYFGFSSVDLAVTQEAPSTRSSPTYQRIKAHLDSVPAIDTHNHLWPFDKLPGYVETERGRGMNLAGIWTSNYFTWLNPLTRWKAGDKFKDWWSVAKHDFDNARASSFYRYNLPAFQDLYGVDFDRITDEQAGELNDRIFENYQDPAWLYHVVTERANIELMFNDPHWARFDFAKSYPWEVLVLNVGTLTRGFHPSEFKNPSDDPYHFAQKSGLSVAALDDYLTVLDRLFRTAKERGAACLKHTLAYRRTLRFENVSKERAARAFGRPRSELSREEIADFEDFIMWRLAELSARYSLPFQIHTGIARIQGSNPMLLVNLIAGKPEDEVHSLPRGVPLDRRDGRDRDAVSASSLDRFRVAAVDQLYHGQARLPRVARGDAVRSDHVGCGLQSRRGNLRLDRIHAPLPGGGPGGEGNAGRFTGGARQEDRPADIAGECPDALPAAPESSLEAQGTAQGPGSVRVLLAPASGTLSGSAIRLAPSR